MKEKLAEEAALREGYYQSDKTQYTVTPWMNYNLFVRAFIAGWEAREASIGGGEAEIIWNAACKKVLEDISLVFLHPDNLKQATPNDQAVLMAVGETIKNFPYPKPLLSSPLTKEGDEFVYDGYGNRHRKPIK